LRRGKGFALDPKDNIMKYIKNHCKNFLLDECGATAIEYGMLSAMMGVALVLIANSQYGLGINQGFSQLGSSFVSKSSF
jgi:pilus assembly protein Flp/PilA